MKVQDTENALKHMCKMIMANTKVKYIKGQNV